MSQSWENLQTDGRMDRTTKGRKDKRMNRPYFIGPFWPRSGVQLMNKFSFFKISINPLFGLLLAHCHNFGGKKGFPKNQALSSTTSYGFLAQCQNSEKTNDPIQRKLTDRRKDGQKEGRMDRPYFIGLFQPRPEVQKLRIETLFTQCLSFWNMFKSISWCSNFVWCLWVTKKCW